MKRKRSIWLWLIVLLATLLLSVSAFAEESTREGIKVHGHWKIEIFNPDGTRVKMIEFENDLSVPGGPGILVYMLTGRSTHGAWHLDLRSINELDPCEDAPEGNPTPCLIGEIGVNYNRLIHSPTLTVEAGGGLIILKGNVTAARNGNIGVVKTWQVSCPPRAIPQDITAVDDCRSNLGDRAEFTTYILPDPPGPVSVVAGQFIQVTVDISFS